MKIRTVALPDTERILKIVGENIKLARKRRHWTLENMVERTDLSRPTISSIENGSPNVAIGRYLKVALAMDMENDFLAIAGDDELGRHLQDSDLLNK